ncbi:unnamed protein product [Clonostachys chloroleuca]|uniref:NAD(P)-binding domain-containing protein n=1 Tax=Clonostachys chloroleuca TaxID=1926264 RepID=A0AA35Q7T6_9HYPO|nr:unnamed protein product [Clonostachys chloroleuca]
MASVLVFGPTGKVGSYAARTAAEHGAKVWLAMRDTTKTIPGLTGDAEKAGGFNRVQADLQKPETVSEAVKTSGAKRAFIYLVHGAPDHLKGSIEAMKAAGIEFVVFLSSFTILVNQGLRDISPSDYIAYVHAQVEANLEDTFGPDNYVALRPGGFVTNLLAEREGIIAGKLQLYGGIFEQDNIVPSDIGKVAGTVLVSGPRNGQKKVYLYGPQIRSIHDSYVEIGRVLGKDLEIITLGPEDGLKKYISRGMGDNVAKYMVEIGGTKGPDKGNGERFPRYQEGAGNVQLYTGKPSTSLEDWVKENTEIFKA